MPDRPIPAEAIEAAAKALWDRPRSRGGTKNSDTNPQWANEKGQAEAALRAAFDALGTEVERQAAQEGMEEAPARERLVSRWFPVKP